MSKLSLRLRLRAAVAWCVLIALAPSGVAVWASELRATKDFADVAAAVDQYVEKYGAEHVLLALDIDNTIMSMDNDLGSDHWFEWQRYLLENEPDSPMLVGKTFDELLKVQGLLYQRTHMHPPQKEQPAMVADLQKQGIATVLLTSRGPEFRPQTERELKRCKYDIAATALSVRGLPAGTFLAFDPEKPEKDGLTAAEIVTFQLPPPRPVSYENGLFLTAGQHKGVMLVTLLKDSPRDIKAVVFLDDNVKHVGDVFSAATDRNLDIASFHWRHEDTRVARFNYSDKQDVDRRWKAIQRELAGEKVATVKETAPRTVTVRKVSPRRIICRRCCCR
jgi:hypothetical protein